MDMWRRRRSFFVYQESGVSRWVYCLFWLTVIELPPRFKLRLDFVTSTLILLRSAAEGNLVALGSYWDGDGSSFLPCIFRLLKTYQDCDNIKELLVPVLVTSRSSFQVKQPFIIAKLHPFAPRHSDNISTTTPKMNSDTSQHDETKGSFQDKLATIPTSVTLSAEQFERLYLTPMTRRQPQLAKNMGNPTPL